MPTGVATPIGPIATGRYTIDINWDRIEATVLQGAVSGLNGSANKAYLEAQRRVPVRKVFRNQTRRQFRTLSFKEQRSAVKAARGLGYIPASRIQINRVGPKPEVLRRLGIKDAEGYDFARRQRVVDLATLLRRGGLSAEKERTFERELTSLTAAGRRDLERGLDMIGSGDELESPVVQTGETIFVLGGRLKHEIYVEQAEYARGTYRMKARVASPTRYAKYVEFGTRHAAAQPYLRPALMEVRMNFRETMIKQIRMAGAWTRAGRRSPEPPAVSTGGLQSSMGVLGQGSLTSFFINAARSAAAEE